MGMTVGIKSSGDRHLDLHFSSSNHDGNGKWGSLHIHVLDMQDESAPAHAYVELDHADIDKLILELQTAKTLLAGEEPTAVHHHPGLPSMMPIAAADSIYLAPMYPKLMTQFEPEAICLQCGYRADRHSYSGACIEKLPLGMIRFSKTERFRA